MAFAEDPAGAADTGEAERPDHTEAPEPSSTSGPSQVILDSQETVLQLSLDTAEKEAREAVSIAIDKLRTLKAAAGPVTKEIKAFSKAFSNMAASSASSRSTSQASSRSSSASSSDRRRARPRRKNPVTPSHGPAGPLQSPPFISRYVVNQWGDSHVPQQGIAGLPALQVFYRSLPKDCPDITNVIVNPSIEELKKAHDNAHATEKPMRMRIGSLAIIQELEVISGLALPPVCEVIAPFKLLIHHWDGIRLSLERLNSELNELEAQDNPSDSAGAASKTLPPETPSILGSPETSRKKTHSDKPTISPSEAQWRNLRMRHLRKLQMPMKSLATFITAELGHLIGLRLKIQEGSLESVAFEELYHLYSPGDIIVDNRSEFEQLQQVYAVTGGRQRLSTHNASSFRPPASEEEADDFKDGGEGTWTDFVLDCLEMRWNGTHIGPSRKIRRISPYTGQRKVMELECYPVQFHEKHDELCKSLTERGRKVVQCHGHKEYDGVSAKEPELSDRRWRAGPPPPYGRHPEPSRQQSLVKELSGDVYVDVQSFHKERYNEFTKLGRARPSRREVEESGLYRIKVTSFTDHAVDQRRSDQFLSDNLHLTAPQRIKDLKHISPDCLRLLPHSVPGYYLRQREWVWLDIDTLEEIDKSQQARTRGWEDLVIDEGYSGLLLPLVDNHNFAVGHKRKNVNGHNVPTAQIDLVKGKGRGLIILLHGPPGTGKTSTAEAIAAYTGKPLYAITCGDIGTDPENVERNLLEHMQRAEQWGCVLLLDEADVFLAKRTWTDIRRNALVSVFLRHLEYYSGILFLTTNIVGIIDEAFKSRIHVALRYDAIDLGTTKKIWSNVLNRILKDNEYADVQIMFKRTALLEFAEWHYEEHEDAGTTWNARQIRNAFSIAIAMAQFDRLERISEEGLTPEEVDSWPPKKKKTKGSLTMVHLKRKYFAKIADTAADFEDYINAVRGADTENALANHQRNDYFGRMTTPMRKDYHAQTSRGSEQGASRRRAPAKTPSSRASRVEKKTRRRLYSSDEDEEEGEEPEGEAEEEDDDIGKAGKGKASAQRKKKAVFSDDEDLEE